MVSKKITKNDQSEITEEEKQILQQYYNEQQQEEEQPPPPQIKQKRQISDAQRESLTKARELALLKKKELKEITEKKKIIQTMKKEENKLDVEKEYKETIERFANKKEVKQPEKTPERKIKKIIYEDEDETENEKFSYSNFTKKTAMEQMKDKINEDRLKFLYQKYILR
jgi:hypothetical protein